MVLHMEALRGLVKTDLGAGVRKAKITVIPRTSRPTNPPPMAQGAMLVKLGKQCSFYCLRFTLIVKYLKYYAIIPLDQNEQNGAAGNG